MYECPPPNQSGPIPSSAFPHCDHDALTHPLMATLGRVLFPPVKRNATVGLSIIPAGKVCMVPPHLRLHKRCPTILTRYEVGGRWAHRTATAACLLVIDPKFVESRTFESLAIFCSNDAGILVGGFGYYLHDTTWSEQGNAGGSDDQSQVIGPEREKKKTPRTLGSYDTALLHTCR